MSEGEPVRWQCLKEDSMCNGPKTGKSKKAAAWLDSDE